MRHTKHRIQSPPEFLQKLIQYITKGRLGMFTVDIHIQDPDGAVKRRILDAAAAMGIPEGALSAVVVASDGESDYSDCIRKCKGYLGGNTHTAGSAGKTVPFSCSGHISSEIVFTALTLNSGSSRSHECEYFDLYDYTIKHEFGHAIDYFTRSVLQTEPLSSSEVSSEVLAAYYGDLLLAEFAACLHAAKTVSKQQFEAMSTNASDAITQQSGYLKTHRDHIAWFILTQQAQLTGTALHGAGLGSPKANRWSGISEKVVLELEGFIEELQGIATEYPKWELSIIDNLLCPRAIRLGQSL